jgi:hypothetical protein
MRLPLLLLLLLLSMSLLLQVVAAAAGMPHVCSVYTCCAAAPGRTLGL